MSQWSGRNAETLEPGAIAGSIRTGEAADGEFHCSGCGYGVIVAAELPRCPMCSGTAWEQLGWDAIRRRATILL